MKEICKQHPSLLVSRDGRIFNAKSGREYKFITDKFGYHKLSTRINNNSFSAFVHRIIAMHYIPNPENKPQVNHKNGIKTDNRVENLEWVTNSENQRHALATGLRKIQYGENTSSAQHTSDEIHNVCKLLSEGYRNVDIAKMTGVCRTKIKDIRMGSSWTTISKDYIFPKRSSSISVETVKWICLMLEKKESVKNIVLLSGNPAVTTSKVRHIKRRTAYIDISKAYTF